MTPLPLETTRCTVPSWLPFCIRAIPAVTPVSAVPPLVPESTLFLLACAMPVEEALAGPWLFIRA